MRPRATNVQRVGLNIGKRHKPKLVRLQDALGATSQSEVIRILIESAEVFLSGDVSTAEVLDPVVPGLHEALIAIAQTAKRCNLAWPIQHSEDEENEHEIFMRIISAIRKDVVLKYEEDESYEPLVILLDTLYRTERERETDDADPAA